MHETLEQKLDMTCLKHDLCIEKIVEKEENLEKTTLALLKKRLKIINKQRRIIKKLQKIPRIEQKSEEWYNVRNNLITASDFAQALGEGKFGSIDDLLKKKVRPVSNLDDTFSKNNPFFAWGNMFEPVANDIYSAMHKNVKIHEFGLLKHPSLDFFGASPDGISDMGIMLEIKCPYKRKIEFGQDVPTQYYYQIQGQLEVCGLSECDYFECQFQLYNARTTFENTINDDLVKGVIIVDLNSESVKSHKYSPLIMDKFSSCNTDKTNEDNLNNINDWIESNTSDNTIEIKYWYLQEFNLKRVYLDKKFVDSKLQELDKFWQRVQYYRNNPDKYEIEVMKKLDIGTTSRLRSIPEKKVITGYSFIEDPNE
jgi:putative phage-type endonuclease